MSVPEIGSESLYRVVLAALKSERNPNFKYLPVGQLLL